MEAINEIQLPPVMQKEQSDNPDLNSTNNLPTINTDDLPITPLRSKRWLNNLPDLQKAKISLNLTPMKSPSISAAKSQDNNTSPYTESVNSSYNELNNLNLPNTDNLLDINVPKTTLLGKEQAKKRLHAFSLSKQTSLNVSPLSKKRNVRQPKFLLQPAEDKYNENGEKTEEKFILVKKPARKSANPNEKAKAVIEEIEEIKKIESAYLEALEQGLLDQRNRRSRSKSRSRERSKRHSSRKEHRRSRSAEIKPRKSWEKPRYPINWAEFNHKGYNLETLAELKLKEYKIKDNEPIDFRKLLLFQTPSLPLHRLTVKTLNGKERIIPAEYIRFTNKSPRISYSTKEKMPNDFYSRKCVLQYVPKTYRENIKKITNSSVVVIDSELPIKPGNSRKWFPKTILSKSEENTECKILETSLGLSFLQTYSDDEQEKDVNDDGKINKIEETEGKDTEEEFHKEKKEKKKEKKKSKPKKEKHKKKKKKVIKEKDKVDDDNKKKHLEHENKAPPDDKSEIDQTKKRKGSKSNDTKEKDGRSSSKEEKFDKIVKPNKRTYSDNIEKLGKEEEKQEAKDESDLNKSDNLKKTYSRKNQVKEKQDASPYKSKNEDLQPKSNEKVCNNNKSSPKTELGETTRKVKCVAEKEFGTPDTEEYYSNWESDVELTNSEKPSLNESVSIINQSWQSDEDPLEISDITISDIPLIKSPFKDEKLSLNSQEQTTNKRTYKSVEKRRTSLRDRSSSPLRRPSRHLDNFPLGLSPIKNEFSPSIQLPPTPNDFSPFRNRIEERRRSRRSMERSPQQEKFLEMPLNIRNTRYSRKQWDEERFDNDKYNRSPEHVVEFGDNKMYALYAENPWERDDYLTIKTEEIRLEEERRTLIEERRKLEIERRKFEEMERQRYYNRMTEFDEKRCGFEERRQEEFKTSDDEDKRYRTHRDYRETRDHPQYSKENDIFPSRRSSEDQRSRRRYSPERIRDSFNWEDTVDTKRMEKYSDKSQEQEANKKRRKSRWQNIDDLEPLHYEGNEQEALHNIKNETNKSESVLINKPEHKSYGKEKKIVRKNRWESSEDEIDRKSNEKIPNRQQEQNKKIRDVKFKERKDKECLPVLNKEKHKQQRTTYKKEEEKSLTDNLDLPPRKPISRPSSISATTTSQPVKKPEVLENEYEKFMQALGSEISTTEEISEKDFQQRKSKPTDKRIKKRKSYSRSVSLSSDEEEYEKKHSKREIRKRKMKKRVSSSSSSSTSSSSSGSDSSTDSSSMSSSSELSSDEEKKRRFKKQKIEAAVKVKMENKESQHKNQEKMVSKPSQSDINSFDVIAVNRIQEMGIKEIIKIEDSTNLSTSNTSRLLIPPNKITSVGANLNITNLTIPEFSLGEIPLPNNEVLKTVFKASEVPQPVPSPKLSLITSTNEPKIDLVMSKMEPDTFPKNEPEIKTTSPILSEILPPVTPTFEALSDQNVCSIKEEPTTPEEQKFSLTDALVSPAKRNNLIPIKFLTAELRKQANESPNIKPLGTIEAKDNLISGNQLLIDGKTNALSDKNDAIEALPLTNRKRHFAMSSINLPAKRPLLDDSDNDENSTDFTDKFIRKDENTDEVSTSIEMTSESASQQPPLIRREKSFERDRTSKERNKDNNRRKQRSISPRRKRDFSPRSSRRDSRSPRRHDSSKRWSKDVSPRRRERDLSPRNSRMSPGRWDRNGSPRRGSGRDVLRRGRDDSHYRRHSTSPGHKENRRDRRSISPGNKKHMSPRHRSPSLKRRSMSREFSPRRHRSKERSCSKDRKLESIQETLQRIAGVDKYSNRMKHSPLSSPLHGFKRSVADSTISDEQLLQHNSEEYAASPGYNNTEYFKNSPSPKRMSLDERISQALGLADQQPKPISTTYSANYECDPQYFDQYGQYYEQYGEQNQKSGMYGQMDQCYRQSRQRESSNLKVVQVGNVLQVVPIEDVPPKQSPVQQNKITNSTQKIVQVGNMLQIVPTATLPEIPIEPAPVVTPIPSSAPSTPTPSTSTIKDPLNAETLIKQKAERRAEKDKRRQEREKKRKEKEKKRKEREKRKQFKVKMQTEAMIKQALIRETEEAAIIGNEENPILENTTSECQAPVQWPPAPQIVCNSLYKPAGKGILSQGSRGNQNEEGESKRKTVKFSDGVMPGEGTSPSGGEELSSPPPAPKKLPKEKRFVKTKVPKKVKVPKKKKVKVKVIRQQQIQGTEDDDEDDDDNLPPPPPPPGSPPPHIFPARIKLSVINNIHPNIVVSIAANQPTNTSYPPPPVYRSAQPPVMMPHHHGHHHGLPHLPPHGHHHPHHPPPCPPPHHGGFNPPTVVVPPVISVVPSVPIVMPCYPPQHNHHHRPHHHGGPHHHSPGHHGHHHH